MPYAARQTLSGTPNEATEHAVDDAVHQGSLGLAMIVEKTLLLPCELPLGFAPPLLFGASPLLFDP